jgi:hypothetical protein
MLAEGFIFYLATARQHEDRVRRQITRLGLTPLLSGVFVSQIGPQIQGCLKKAQLTRHLGLTKVVGDSEVDQAWACELDVSFMAVACGSRCRDYWVEKGIESYGHAVEVFAILRAGR